MKIIEMFYALSCMALIWFALGYICGNYEFQFLGCYLFGPGALGTLVFALERKPWDILLSGSLTLVGYAVIDDMLLALESFVVVLAIIVMVCIVRLALEYAVKRISEKRSKRAPQ